MATYNLKTQYKKLLADTITPVGLYLKLRDHFAHTFMLESSDYHGSENSFSYICFDPLGKFELSLGEARMEFPDGAVVNMRTDPEISATFLLQQFMQSFQVETLDLPFTYNGLFGYHCYDAVRYYEEVAIQTCEEEERKIPEMLYQVFRFVIAIDHFKNELHIFEHRPETEEGPGLLEKVVKLMANRSIPSYNFETIGEEETNQTDEEFLRILAKGKEHCLRGDVFQIVLSRQYSKAFRGDEFNVYRALRSINPSPYLFYCDYGGFKLFGSSPEAQLFISEGEATIHPIAGTFRRTGDDQEDSRLARELFEDPKENSEHVMLVDLARNDLSRNGSHVEVETFKEVQFYSHVIHLVSKVTARIAEGVFSLKLVADTFPAGTLSGAPKHKAIQLINRYENQNRGFYGGCIGVIGFDESFNHAIIIRSFMSKNNRLYYQAGAGIVARSEVDKELQEVHNKLGALRSALALAEGSAPSQVPALSTEKNHSKMKILVLDNYDSFTYNLVHMIRDLQPECLLEVRRNDKISVQEVHAYDKLLLSPGPGIPSEAGLMPGIIESCAPHLSILGVCLGHQGIGEAFGASLYNMETVLHGIQVPATVTDTEERLFQGLPKTFLTGRYHSWAIDPATINGQLRVTATDDSGEVMAIRHKEFDVAGLQFHPESILTPEGAAIIQNWLTR